MKSNDVTQQYIYFTLSTTILRGKETVTPNGKGIHQQAPCGNRFSKVKHERKRSCSLTRITTLFRTKEKGNIYSSGTGNKGPRNIITLQCEKYINFCFLRLPLSKCISVCTQITRDLFVTVEYPTVRTTRCVLLTSANLYPLTMLVINRMYLICEYHCTDCLLILSPCKY